MSSVVLDYESYLKRNNVEEIIKELKNKGIGILDILPEDQVIDVKVWNSYVIEIYSDNVSPEVKSIFAKEYSALSKLENIQRALYMLVNPREEITEHVDEDDMTTYRILVGVHGKGEFFNVGQGTKNILTYNNSIGVDVEVDYHRGLNLSDEVWAVLIICIYKENYV